MLVQLNQYLKGSDQEDAKSSYHVFAFFEKNQDLRSSSFDSVYVFSGLHVWLQWQVL